MNGPRQSTDNLIEVIGIKRSRILSVTADIIIRLTDASAWRRVGVVLAVAEQRKDQKQQPCMLRIEFPANNTSLIKSVCHSTHTHTQVNHDLNASLLNSTTTAPTYMYTYIPPIDPAALLASSDCWSGRRSSTFSCAAGSAPAAPFSWIRTSLARASNENPAAACWRSLGPAATRRRAPGPPPRLGFAGHGRGLSALALLPGVTQWILLAWTWSCYLMIISWWLPQVKGEGNQARSTFFSSSFELPSVRCSEQRCIGLVCQSLYI